MNVHSGVKNGLVGTPEKLNANIQAASRECITTRLGRLTVGDIGMML